MASKTIERRVVGPGIMWVLTAEKESEQQTLRVLSFSKPNCNESAQVQINMAKGLQITKKYQVNLRRS